jgi:tetratricopeptide (TPR) repeat protein
MTPPRPQRRLVLAVGLALASGCAGKGEVTAAPTVAVSDTSRAKFGEGVELMNQGAEKYSAAAKAFKAALTGSPQLWEAHLNLGVIALREARLSAAASSLEKSIDIFGSPEALEALGEVYMRQGHAKRAVDLYEQALTRNPGDLSLRNRLAVALRHAGRLDESEAEIRAVLGRDAGNLDAYGTLAAIYMDRDNVDLAELILSKGLARNPNDPRLLTNMGLVHLAHGNDQAAFELFEKASTVDPGFLVGRMNKAAVFLRVGDHARATEELSYILKIEPGNAQALLNLGIAQRLAGEHGDARKNWNQLLSIDPDNAAAHYNLAILDMDFADKPADAKAHLKRYLQLADEEDPNAKLARERFELLVALEKNS